MSPLIIFRQEEFELAHAGCYDEIDDRPARQSIRIPAGANVAQAFGHDAQAWAKYQCQPRRADFQRVADDVLFSWGDY